MANAKDLRKIEYREIDYPIRSKEVNEILHKIEREVTS